MKTSPFNHFDKDGNAVMVDVGRKEPTNREAIAKGYIKVSQDVFQAIQKGTVAKGDVLGIARTAGIMAVKKTWDLIPLCHPLPIHHCTVDFSFDSEQMLVYAVCTVKVYALTGVEMEALTGVNISLLTIYDMCKALDKSMEIGGIHVVKKTGGKSGPFLN